MFRANVAAIIWELYIESDLHSCSKARNFSLIYICVELDRHAGQMGQVDQKAEPVAVGV